jgi:hypothetical protein
LSSRDSHLEARRQGPVMSTLPAAHERVRDLAFALLLTHSRPVLQYELAAASGAGNVGDILDFLAERGWIDRDDRGNVTGSAGLSLSDGSHHLQIRQRTFRTWCAYDALGIPAALRESAQIQTACGMCAAPISLHISDGRPTRNEPERLWLAAGRGHPRASFCTPTVLLCGPDHGAEWAQRHDRRGELMSVERAAELGAAAWAAGAAAVHRCADLFLRSSP